MGNETYIAKVEEIELMATNNKLCPCDCEYKVLNGNNDLQYYCNKYSSMLGSHNCACLFDQLDGENQIVVFKSPFCNK
jgi:hypothetical protein